MSEDAAPGPNQSLDPAEPTSTEALVVDPRLARSGPAWIAAFVGLVVCTQVAASTYATLIVNHPVGLISLSSRNRFLAVTAINSGVSWWEWAGVATLRLGAAAVVCHVIGRIYGERALRWFWRFLGMREDGVRQFERQFDVAEWALVPLFVGSNLVFVLSGAARSSWKRLVPLFLVGVAGRLALIWWLAHAFESQLTSLIDFMTRHQWKIIIISVAVVVVANLRNLLRGR